MKGLLKKSMSLLLAATMCLLGACQDSGQQPQEIDSISQAKGRYVEEEITLPEANIVSAGQLETGEIVCFGVVEQENWKMVYWTLSDDGRTWTEHEMPQLDAYMQDKSFSPICTEIAPQGGIYVSYNIYKDDAFAGEKFAYFGFDGSVKEFDYALPADEAGSAAEYIVQAGNGDLLLNAYFSVIQIDAETGEIRHTYQPDETLMGMGLIANFQDQFAHVNGQGIALYDLETGEQTQVITIDDAMPPPEESNKTNSNDMSGRALTSGKESQELIYCDPSGIYRVVPGNAVSERLVQGAQVSLGMPSFSIQKVFSLPDNTFFVYCTENTPGYATHFFRYTYDPDVPTVPSKELTVYSLDDNETVRQAIGMYQRENPDVLIDYMVGISGEDAVTAADALRTLSTELIAGKGPDILVLDGMPVESYIQKGILADLSSLDRSGLLEKVVKTYQIDDKLYGIPARFTTLMLNGDEDALDSIHTLHEMLQYQIKNNSVVSCNQPGVLLEMLYPIYSASWFDENNRLKRDVFSQSLEDLKGISTLRWILPDPPEDNIQYEPELEFGAMDWRHFGNYLNFGYLVDLKYVAPAWTIINDDGKGKIKLFPDEANSVFVPQTILGVNAASAQAEDAAKFVQYALSKEVLSYSFESGLPVHIEALRENAKNPNPERDFISTFGKGYDDDDGEMLMVRWPSDEIMQDLIADLQKIETPSPVNGVLMQLILDEAQGYFDGSRTLEDTVNAVEQKIGIYLAEQQ